MNKDLVVTFHSTGYLSNQNKNNYENTSNQLNHFITII